MKMIDTAGLWTILILVICLLAGSGIYKYLKNPDPCVDTVQLISVVPGNPSQASCPAGMTMEIENRVQGALVKCHCPRTDR